MINHNFKKKFGQNFLQTNMRAYEILNLLSISEGDNIIEIGPGKGVLTELLVESNANIQSVEIDKELHPFLLKKFKDETNFKLIDGDILDYKISFEKGVKYFVTGSLPYNISKKIIRKFLSANSKPQKMVFIVQKEVGLDYSLIEGKNSFLSISTSYYADVKIHSIIKNHEFFPIPKVDGIIIEFKNIKDNLQNIEEKVKFIKLGFSQPRKKLSSNLSNYYKTKDFFENLFEKLNISKSIRASELNRDDWDRIYNSTFEIHD